MTAASHTFVEANIHLSEGCVLFQAQWALNFSNATTKWNISEEKMKVLCPHKVIWLTYLSHCMHMWYEHKWCVCVCVCMYNIASAEIWEV